MQWQERKQEYSERNEDMNEAVDEFRVDQRFLPNLFYFQPPRIDQAGLASPLPAMMVGRRAIAVPVQACKVSKVADPDHWRRYLQVSSVEGPAGFHKSNSLQLCFSSPPQSIVLTTAGQG